MPSREKGYVSSVVKEKKEFIALLLEQFSDNYLLFVENPQDPSEFGSSKIPDSIEFPGFIFDSKEEVRWFINDGKFFVTIISDELIPAFSEVGGNWTREGIGKHFEGAEESDEIGVFLVDPEFPQINIKSETLKIYLKENNLLEKAELFSKDAIPMFLTLRRWQE